MMGNKSGGKKRPQNREVGAESASTMTKWGRKAPPQFQMILIRFSG